jgi:AmmeMemoRadiSam system protein A
MASNEHSPLVDLARRTIEHYVRTGRVLAPPEELPPEMQGRAGVFVSIHKKDGSLRGCIGTFEPTQSNIALEIIQNAISAATRDPRFPPITEDELDDLQISVDVLSKPERVNSLEELDPKKYGVIVQSGWRRGLLLPDLEGVDTVEQQVAIAMRKAGIAPGEPVQLYRFTVKRYH